MRQIKHLLLALAMVASAASAETVIYKPSFFGGEYDFMQIDSMKRPNKFLPSTLYVLSKEGQHIG